MSNRVYIHIGLPKTATTTLQLDYFPHVDNQDYVYLGAIQPRDAISDPLYYDLCRAINCGENVVSTNKKLKIRLREERKSLIISDEMFTVSEAGVSWQSKLSYLSEVLNGVDFRILMTVREPVSAMFSFYIELYDRYRDTKKSFKELALGDNDFRIYHYDGTLYSLESYFDRSQIYIQKFESLVSGNFESVNEFLDYPKMETSFIELSNHNQKRKKQSEILVSRRFKLRWISTIYHFVGGDRNLFARILKNVLRKPLKKLRGFSYRSVEVPKLTDLEKQELTRQMQGSMDHMAEQFGFRYGND